jgi:major vault protein
MKMFGVRDCIGEMCFIMGSRVRGAVADLTLNLFHKNSARIIRKAVLGEDPKTKHINKKYVLSNNLLAITNVDIKNISTRDAATDEKLKVTVNLAIELTTKSQEETAKREADRKEQEAKSLLNRNVMEDNSKAQELKKLLFELASKTATIQEEGTQEAEAKAKAKKMQIESLSNINIAKNKKDLQKLKNDFNNEMEELRHNNAIEYEKEKNKIAIEKKKALTNIETSQFKQIIDIIGADTLVDISNAGPESQVKLLQAIGLEGFVMTNGSSPINLFNFAKSIVNTNQVE